MTTKAKKEISHKQLDNNKRSKSARSQYKIGKLYEHGQLIDKIIYPINICPKCKSKATFHRRMQENDDFVPNVWDRKIAGNGDNTYISKFDYCLDCHSQFLIELYIFRKPKPRKKRKKKSLWSKLSKK